MCPRVVSSVARAIRVGEGSAHHAKTNDSSNRRGVVWIFTILSSNYEMLHARVQVQNNRPGLRFVPGGRRGGARFAAGEAARGRLRPRDFAERWRPAAPRSAHRARVLRVPSDECQHRGIQGCADLRGVPREAAGPGRLGRRSAFACCGARASSPRSATRKTLRGALPGHDHRRARRQPSCGPMLRGRPSRRGARAREAGRGECGWPCPVVRKLGPVARECVQARATGWIFRGSRGGRRLLGRRNFGQIGPRPSLR